MERNEVFELPQWIPYIPSCYTHSSFVVAKHDMLGSIRRIYSIRLASSSCGLACMGKRSRTTGIWCFFRSVRIMYQDPGRRGYHFKYVRLIGCVQTLSPPLPCVSAIFNVSHLKIKRNNRYWYMLSCVCRFVVVSSHLSEPLHPQAYWCRWRLTMPLRVCVRKHLGFPLVLCLVVLSPGPQTGMRLFLEVLLVVRIDIILLVLLLYV